MQKHSFPHLEDYIEYLAGYPTSNLARPGSMSLARYDTQIVSSIAGQTINGTGFSDRQALLAHKLVVKYKRQFANNDILIGEHEEDPKFRLPLRQVDRAKTITVKDKQIILRFPYDTKMIDVLREYGKKIPGNLSFNKPERYWETTITEPRVLWACEFADKYEFEVDANLLELKEKIDLCQQEKYVIELDCIDNQLVITNAESSLINYINENIGGLNEANLSKLFDQSGVLGYTVSEQLFNLYDFGHVDTRLVVKKENHLPWNSEDTFEKIINYAEWSQRYPIFVFDPLNENKPDNAIVKKLTDHFKEDLITVGRQQRRIDYQDKKCVYLTNWHPSWQIKIPLLVTLTGLMVGLKKEHILQHSEKVVFSSEIIYNL
jgi:hypothetical protein